MSNPQHPRNGLRDLREATGWTINALAEELGVHRDTIVQWEKGTSHPRLDHAHALSRALGITVEQVVNIIAGVPFLPPHKP